MNRNGNVFGFFLIFIVGAYFAALQSSSFQAPIHNQHGNAALSPVGTITPYPSESVYYEVQHGSPIWLSNFAHPEKGCDAILVAGQVFDSNSSPVSLIVVEVGGWLNGQKVSQLSLTGVAPFYGPGGYEVILPDRDITENQLWIRLYDLKGQPLSNTYFFNSYDDCERNLTIVNFVQIAQTNVPKSYYLPIVQGNSPK
jgi:hypothetical protein